MLKTKDLSFCYPKTNTCISYPNIELQAGEIIALMGASGFGKSSFLNLAAGLLTPTGGELQSDFSSISYAFQEPRLFPWLTVKENIHAVLSKKAEDASVLQALSFVDLASAADLYPSQLSGGMKSRISLARAIAYDGELFLLDEPFAALDGDLRRSLCQKLREHLKAHQKAAILVTHTEEDAKLFADRIIELS